jgi:enoyl-CoA hydratase/carnithine racemase
MTTSSVLRERPADGVEVLRIDRPQVRNALDSETIAALVSALDAAAADDTVRALVLSTTNVRAFCAGADVAETLDHEGGVARMEAFTRLYSAVDAFPVPVVCVCVGNVVGAGAELAAGSDLRVGGDNLRLAWAGSRVGAPVGPARLTPLIGLAAAKDLIFTGRTVGMEEASSLGFLQRVSAADEAEGVAVEVARAVAAHPSDGVRALKAMFRSYEGLEARIADENARLVAFQRDGVGLPRR